MDSVDFDALEHEARRLMPPASWAFCVAGADDEISMVENITDWRALRLRPREPHHWPQLRTLATLKLHNCL